MIPSLTSFHNVDASVFTPQPIFNDHEEQVFKILELVFGNKYRINTQTPLQQICSRNHHWLEADWFQFHANSTIDLLVYQKFGYGEKFPKLAVECQSKYHDTSEAQVRDQRKQYLLDSIHLPLIQVRYVGSGGYRFYSHRLNDEVYYDGITQEGLLELKNYIHRAANISEISLDAA
jgi:hypothetical protein